MNAPFAPPASSLPERDNEGYLRDPALWSADIASRLAAEEGLELDHARWRVVAFIHDYYEEHEKVPEARTLLAFMSEQPGDKLAANRRLYALFPRGYGQQACKIAGMRKPLKLMLDV